MKHKISIITLLACGIPFVASSKLSMPHLFSDNMVIQADTVARLWGHAEPGALVSATGSWGAESSCKADSSGHWQLGIATPAASYEALCLTVTDKSDGHSVTFNNVLAGEVWIASGQSNMDMPLRGYWHQPVEGGGDEITFAARNGRGIRFLNVPRTQSYTLQHDIDASWQTSNPQNTAEFSALAWFFARSLKDIIDMPVGIINAAYGGSKVEAWVPEEILAGYPDCDYQAEKNDSTVGNWDRTGAMYNAMIHPIAGFTARGFIWNQGESNVGRHAVYPARQNDMITHWRKVWGDPGMQFYFVELPGYDYGDAEGTGAALFREAQHKAARETEGAHIVCTSDLVYPDEADDIHGRNKRDIGKRLAACAATHSYGIKGIPHRFPSYKSVDLKGDKALVWFNDMWQGFTPNENLQGFEVAGEDRVFHPAVAEIDRNGLYLTVSSPEVADIKSVRYCFKNFAIGRVHDMLGMPIVPFRTDDWDK
ncbi:MAG: sialate O-acetylesterase [Muribaculaceae bacterium]|nr:sialate O-acetylesterase [Muribaculaceae bacterium]